ncbi:conserved exported hypothetical protein [Alteromonas sp. 38]|uniref:DUF547 domain-containing protein n=1 Tax=unclassified Alteromonas TaxID=2614992 RepID=UPI0012F304AB|nr:MULTISPECIES: DUF547 domain-containing protein [unclassified Alteromonas]CAD5272564.1 conserved exported hypothetical protein [Alteromonas sp. 154]VXB52746.1 conserved exported hypothetical protein [Alteromonas sp. 38]
MMKLSLGLNRLKRTTQLLVVTALLVMPLAHAEEGLHTPFSAMLAKYVVPINPVTTRDGVEIKGTSTEVDYAGFKASQSELSAYLKSLSAVSKDTFSQWDKNTQLAFLINAYNAYTIDLILTRYPDLTSIRDIGGFFSSPWKQAFAPLLGEKRTLDDLEHGLIRAKGVYNEPRIHFAVNCASIGCPALREEAYVGDKLNEQLEQQTVRFLSDNSRNYYDGNTLHISKIFSWYKEDFEMKWRDSSSLTGFIAQYENALSFKDGSALDDNDIKAILSGKSDIEFLDYNWALNDQE